MSTVNKLKSILCVACAAFVFAALSGCGPGGSTDDAAPDGEKLLDSLVRDGSFAFEGCDWFISQSDFMGQSGLGKDDIELEASGDILIIRAEKSFDEPEITVASICDFSDDRLVSGAYHAGFDSEEELLECGARLKAYFDDALDAPFLNTTAVLEQVPPNTGSGTDVKWMADDGSQLGISLFNHTETQPDSPHYLIVIQVAAPKE